MLDLLGGLDVITLVVPFEPVAKGRPRFVKATWRAFTPPKTALAEWQVRQTFLASGQSALQGPLRPLLALVVELRELRDARPSPNGHVGRYTHTCASCGREFTSNRRQLANHRAWCGRPECRKVAATERARAYRERRAQTNA